MQLKKLLSELNVTYPVLIHEETEVDVAALLLQYSVKIVVKNVNSFITPVTGKDLCCL